MSIKFRLEVLDQPPGSILKRLPQFGKAMVGFERIIQRSRLGKAHAPVS
jgi:hypothetical protein